MTTQRDNEGTAASAEAMAAAAIVAEATAIALAAEAELIAERRSSVRLAAHTAHNAAAKAAATVALAAERARITQEVAVSRAAADVATSAAASAVEMQQRAEEMAAVLLFGGTSRSAVSGAPAASPQQVRAAAEQTERTDQAARVVAAMVASSAQSVAVTAAALAATTAMQVSLAAKAVQAVAESTAREVQTVNVETVNDELLRAADRTADGGSTQNALLRVVDQQIEAWRSLKDREVLRGELLATVTHELKTPLACVHAYLELFTLDPPTMTDDQKMYLGIALSNVERIDTLVSDLQSSVNTHSGPPVAKGEVDLDELLASAIDSIQPDMHRNDQRFITHLDHRSAVLYADYDELHRALINLLTNASKYTPRKGTIHLNSVTDHAGVQISVTDTGPGISPADQDRLFERSFRVDPARAGAPTGSGLGLAIVDRIVKDNNGTVTVRSELGQGSTFTISLPVRILTRPTDKYDDR